jgi:hypothetical protein
MILANDSKEALQKRAEASFKKLERAREGAEAWMEHEAEARATREKTARLRALRLAKEGLKKNEGDMMVARKESNDGPQSDEYARPIAFGEDCPRK